MTTKFTLRKAFLMLSFAAASPFFSFWSGWMTWTNPRRPTAAYRRCRRAAGTAERVGRFAQVQAAAAIQSAQGSASEAADPCLCFATLKSVTLFLVAAKTFGQVVCARRRSETIPLPKCEAGPAEDPQRLKFRSIYRIIFSPLRLSAPLCRRPFLPCHGPANPDFQSLYPSLL
jgi:hypothetical protein